MMQGCEDSQPTKTSGSLAMPLSFARASVRQVVTAMSAPLPRISKLVSGLLDARGFASGS
jgi:hypothetical protein